MGDLKLNIGAGATFLPGFVNLDIDEKADIQLDLSKDRLPFDDNSVSLVFSYHTLEHVADYLFALGEMYRVLHHDGALLLGLPYVASTQYHLVNPYHLHNFSEHSFAFFDDARLKGRAREQNDILFKQVFCRYVYFRGFRHLPLPLKAWSRRHLLNVVRWFEVGLVAVKDRESRVDVSENRGSELRSTFDHCRASRVYYDNGRLKGLD